MGRRHSSLARRKPEGTATIRHQQMNKKFVEKYFSALKEVFDTNQLNTKPHLIWNMDETGMILEHRPTKVIARRGSRYLQSRTSGNRELITVIAAVNATGKVLPPHMVVKGKSRLVLNGFDSDKAPEGTVMSVSDSGWTKQGIAALWFTEVFLKHIGPERPQVLVMDGHDSHCYVEFIEKAMAEGIILIELPSHTSHWLQPLDRSVFYSLKRKYNEACQDFLNDWPNLTICHRNFCELFVQAWNKAMNVSNIASGFEATGIMPFNPDKIPSDAYIPNTLYATTGCTETTDAEQTTEQASDVIVAELRVDIDGNEVAKGCDRKELESSARSSECDLQEAVVGEQAADVGASELFTDAGGKKVDERCGTLELMEPCALDVECVSEEVEAEDTRVIGDGVTHICPPDLALAAIETSLTPETLRQYKKLFNENRDKPDDAVLCTWKLYKIQVGLQQIKNDVIYEPEAQPTVNQDPVLNMECSEEPALQLQPLSASHFYKSSTGDKKTSHSVTVHTVDFPFSNTSFPSDVDSDVLPYPQLKKDKPLKKKNKEHYFVLTAKEVYEESRGEKEEADPSGTAKERT